MLLNDKQITDLSQNGNKMIDPFVAEQVKKKFVPSSEGMVANQKVISYGVSSFGYDAKVSNEFKVFSNANGASVVDPKSFDENCFVEHYADDSKPVIIPPNSFALARTVEYFRIPEDVMVICVGKSTYARCGIVVNVTPLEPDWEGHVTLEFSNTTPLPAKIYANEGACQFIFLKGERPQTTYADRNGKYQGQQGVTVARV